jgi:isopenicillin-N epimerase
MKQLKDQFLLDPEIHFLNHGSFGACPRPVFQAYQEWQRRLERQPVLFLGREFARLHQEARQALGAYLKADPDDMVYIPNATHGVNIIARSLALEPGDEVLATDHEYGACDYTWEFICQKRGAAYRRQPIPLPVHSIEEVVEQFWQGVTRRTKIIYLSHITSPTALRLPVEAICQRGRADGILTVVDGAHAPGQIPLDLREIEADFYVGNCHKWMLSPKGAGFLYARREVQELIEPLVVSWGYKANAEFTSGSRFVDYLQWSGTRDPAAALSVPAAIQFMQDYDWDSVRRECDWLLQQALQRISALTHIELPYPPDSGFYIQMGIAELPSETDIIELKKRLYDEWRVEVPLIEWNGRKFVRLSVQGYNSQEDVDALIGGLEQLLPGV